jgi:succinyl-CoA synthetase beta subunit
LIEQLAIPYVSSGLQYGMRALASVSAWQDTRRRRQDLDALSPKPGHFSVAAKSLATEFAAQEFLRSVGVPVVPTKLAKTPEEAAEAAGEIDGKVVLKVCSAQIAHKSEVGGVRIGIGSDQVADEFKNLLESVNAARPDATIDGVLVSPLRQPGIELIVGITRDPQWGPVLAVGLGGIFVEVLQDSSTRLLPVGPSEVRQMFEELSGARILKGFRGIPAANLDLLIDVVCRVSNAALRIEKLDTLEVNPLRVRDSEIEVLDALVISSQG